MFGPSFAIQEMKQISYYMFCPPKPLNELNKSYREQSDAGLGIHS